MRILGIASHTHDAGVALVEDGVPEIVVEEERFNREKKTQCFPAASLRVAVSDRGLDLADIDCITTPWHIPTFWRTLGWAFLRRFPRSANLVHMRAHPPQQNQLFFGRPFLAGLLKKHFASTSLPPIVAVGHHDSHAASFFVSPFEDAAVLVMDGYGDDSATSLYLGEGHTLRRAWRTNIFNSLGILYTVVTQFLGFRANRDEGKVMGLAALGEGTCVDAFDDIVRLTSDGRYQINMKYFWYDCYGLARPFKPSFYELFGQPRRAGEPLTERHRDLAFALQSKVEETVIHMVRSVAKNYRTRNLCLSGGVALNCVTNARVLEDTDFERVWIPPNACDSGTPLGSALWHHHNDLSNTRRFQLRHAYLGTEYSQRVAEIALADAGMHFERLADDELITRVAADLAEGRIVGWFQGRFEMGPRALGNRSILADPRREDMKDILNRKVKCREPFRPFAPAILQEHVSRWFHIDQADPFMTTAPRVRADKAGLIPSVVHADGTARIQTVDKQDNPRFHALIEAFGRLTGVPIVLNTSFNRHEPIVASPADAISCFLRTQMDCIVLGNCYSGDRGLSATRDTIGNQAAE